MSIQDMAEEVIKIEQPTRVLIKEDNKKFLLNFPKAHQGKFAEFWERVLTLLSTLLLLILFPFQFRVVTEYQRGIIFRLGKYGGDSLVKVDIRVKSLDVVPQTVITKDSVTIRVDAVVYYRVVKPEFAVIHVKNYQLATLFLAQTTLRSVVGQSTLDEVLSKRDSISSRMKSILDIETKTWGIDITGVELKDVILPSSMQRAMAAQAEAERERRAKITLANGEFQASKKLSEAAKIMAKQPGSIQLRYLQTLVEISQSKNHTNIIPLPMKFIKSVLGMAGEKKSIKNE